MAVVVVIHAEEDRPFVEDQLIRPLPALGFDQWVSSSALARHAIESQSLVQAIEKSAAILVVVSAAAARTPLVREQVAAGLKSVPPLIPVRIDGTKLAKLAPALQSLPSADIPSDLEVNGTSQDKALWRALADLLPPSDGPSPDGELSALAQRIRWNEESFSYYLEEALTQHDYNRGSSLMTAFAAHIPHRPYPYAATHANGDLSALRKKRQFTLMRGYAEAVLSSGTSDLKVRRQYAQALIELGEYQHALDVLLQVIREADPQHAESYEARGLVGRCYKQQYVNGRNGGDRRTLLAHAIEAYESVFREDPRHHWHGVNAASLILRATRDGVDVADPKRARTIAGTILENMGSDPRDMWARASRVEALLALNAYEEADKALDAYLSHPDMDAFEVSSTHRQFDEVLQLADNPRGRPLLDRLWQAVERHRAGGGVRGMAPAEQRGLNLMPMLLHVSDPRWEPLGVPDLKIHARLGTVLSISGSAATVKQLLKDPLVIALEQSRRSDQVECSRSLPFIRVAATYPAQAGPFSEQGGGALVAIIDNGIDVLHGAFLDANGKSRIIGIWDQRDKSGTPPTGFDFGTFHSQEAVEQFVATKNVPPELGRDINGHGTHVASIAAGRAAGDFAGGVAPDARLLIVIAASGESIGYSTAHVAALNLIDRVATELKLPVVVNVSQGMNAGAHDGKSALEAAFDHFSNPYRALGRVVVKSAGNERDKNGHATVRLAPHSSEQLQWSCQPDPLWPRDRIELWWSSANEFRFRLRAPVPSKDQPGPESEWVDERQPELQSSIGGVAFSMQFVKRHVDNGDSQLIVEIGSPLAPPRHGEWTLQIESINVAQSGEIHAWIERGGRFPSSFTNHTSEEMTLSIPATAGNVITVAAVDAAEPIVVGSFSSYGPTRDGRNKPDVAAPGVNVIAARGGTTDGAMSMDGTSMAAPHVAGAIALLLSRVARLARPWPAATQIASALQQKTRNYNGRWTPGQGFGVIDVAALLAAF